MNLIELARQRLSKKKIPLETPCKPQDEIEYCEHNAIYPNRTLLVGVCEYCAGNELGEALRPLRERREREAAIEEEKSDAKRLGKKWTKPKPPKSPVQPADVYPQWSDNTAQEEIRQLTLKTLYAHSERLVAAKRDISLSNGLKAERGDRGHLISALALESTLEAFKTILQGSLDKGCVMTVINEFFMVIPEDWIRYPKR